MLNAFSKCLPVLNRNSNECGKKNTGILRKALIANGLLKISSGLIFLSWTLRATPMTEPNTKLLVMLIAAF